MKKVYITSLLLLAMAIALAGCRKAATSTNGGAQPAQEAAANSNSSGSQAAGNAPATGSNDTTARLLGTYVMSEVHAGGVVNMISQLKTEITFMADGSYTRVSKRNGNIYHVDAGQYRLEGSDHIVLAIKMAKQKVYDPPRERTHAFTLSRDGEELRMTSDDGKIAVFRKLKKA